MNHLLRNLAPISPAGWEEIEKEAKRTLTRMLAARKFVDFAGPLGWNVSALSTGRTDSANAPEGSDVQARIRRIRPFVEFRVPFEVSRRELEALDGGAKDPDLDSVVDAARTIAIAEDRAIFHGYPAGHIKGICEEQDEPPIVISGNFEEFPDALAEALTRLRDRGVNGPFAIALGERCFTGLSRSAKSGYPVVEHVQRMIKGPLIWAPGVDGAVTLSMRGEDFQFTSGQDFSIGYLSHDEDKVRLYIEESFTFTVLSPQAAVPMVFGAGEE